MNAGGLTDAKQTTQETLDIQRRVLGLNHPDTAMSIYNLPCIAAHQGNRTNALALLRNALDHRLRSRISLAIDKDTDLVSLHGDPRFTELVALARARAAAH